MDLRAALRSEIVLRDRMNELLPFGAPGQALMLELALARLDLRKVCVTEACRASGAPQTTALRNLDLLEKAGLLTRIGERRGSSLIWVRITDEGMARVSALFGVPVLARVA